MRHYNTIIEEVAKEFNLPVKVVDRAYKYSWKFVRHTIENLPLKQDLTKEEFGKLRTNFNMPFFGKLYLTWDRYNYLNRKYKENIKQNDKKDSN